MAETAVLTERVTRAEGRTVRELLVRYSWSQLADLWTESLDESRAWDDVVRELGSQGFRYLSQAQAGEKSSPSWEQSITFERESAGEPPLPDPKDPSTRPYARVSGEVRPHESVRVRFSWRVTDENWTGRYTWEAALAELDRQGFIQAVSQQNEQTSSEGPGRLFLDTFCIKMSPSELSRIPNRLGRPG
jgi:hypothetical protein